MNFVIGPPADQYSEVVTQYGKTFRQKSTETEKVDRAPVISTRMIAGVIAIQGRPVRPLVRSFVGNGLKWC
jgi:hypothetical protein